MVANPEVTNSIVQDYGPLVSSLCRRMISDPHRAEDAAQESWLEILRSLHGFREDSKLSTWIYTVTKRTVLRHARNERLNSFESLSDYFRADEPVVGFPNPGRELDDDVKRQCDRCLTGILHCLDTDARLAYIMRDIAALSYVDIAGVFETSEQTIRKVVSRSRNKLRRFLNDECCLFNPDGSCKCRMIKHVKDLRLDEEFETLRGTVDQMRIFKEADEMLPRKNFWEKFLI